MVERLSYRRHNHYNTPSNQVRKVRTPGGRIVFQNKVKKAGRQKCGDCKKPLPGIPALRPCSYRRLKKRERRVNRAYGGSRCHSCVKQRILRAFLLDEQKCVQLVLREKTKQKKVDEKPDTSSSKKGGK